MARHRVERRKTVYYKLIISTDTFGLPTFFDVKSYFFFELEVT